jgi:hypothetical protein
MADCWTCNDGEFECPDPCPFIAPGSLSDQALGELMEQGEINE